jgi:hypothetical protein
VWGIDFGLPYELTYDEVHEIVRAFKLGAGEYDWDSFAKGGLYYFLFVEYGLLYLIWKLLGWVADTPDFAIRYFQDPTPFYLAGRLTVAVMGALTCWVVFCIGRRLYNVWVGLGVALIGATTHYHALWSHYINVDIGLTLALWTSVLAYLKYESSYQRRWLLAAGAFGGIAIAFKLTGAIVLPLLLVAIGTPLERWREPFKIVKASVLAVVAIMVTLTIVAPEWTVDSIDFSRFFNRLAAPPDMSSDGELAEAVDAVTIYRTQNYWGYVKILLAPHNVVLVLSALLGSGLALWRRHRWDLIWIGLSLVFIVVMSAAERSATERYILPIMPCFWFLSMRATTTVARQRLWATVIGLACVTALPLATLVYHNYMWTKPDTRVIAKQWIESNISAGAKILSDGQRYRFTMSPPLYPDATAVARRVVKAKHAQRVSRGTSPHTLALYTEAMSRIKGPRYDLHSTVWGVAVEPLSYYVDSCFDYVITSSANAERYQNANARQRFPKSAEFYAQLPSDPRFEAIYTIAAKAWHRVGPTIVVYRVLHTCP